MKCFNKKKFVGQEKSFIIEKYGFLIFFFSACPCWAREGWGEGWREEEGGEVQREGEEGGREGEGRWEEGGKGQRRKGEYFNFRFKLFRRIFSLKKIFSPSVKIILKWGLGDWKSY